MTEKFAELGGQPSSATLLTTLRGCGQNPCLGHGDGHTCHWRDGDDGHPLRMHPRTDTEEQGVMTESPYTTGVNPPECGRIGGETDGPESAGNALCPALTPESTEAGMNDSNARSQAVEQSPIGPAYRVEKQGYSAGPWRVLDAATGEQVWRNEIFDHPMMGPVRVAGPVCFDRKRDAVAWVQAEAHNAQPSTAVAAGEVSA